MTLDEVIKKLEDPCIDCITLNNSELTAWLRELKKYREQHFITKKQAINALLLKGQHSTRYKLGETWELNLFEIQEAINAIPVNKEVNENGT